MEGIIEVLGQQILANTFFVRSKLDLKEFVCVKFCLTLYNPSKDSLVQGSKLMLQETMF